MGQGGECCQMPRAVDGRAHCAGNTLPAMLASLDPLHLFQVPGAQLSPAGEGSSLESRGFGDGEGSWRRWLIIRASKKMGHLAHEAEGGKGHRMTSDM